MPLLEVDKLTMRFGGLTAVSGVDFSVEPGQIFSVIGPNGAGKTTVFNAVSGVYNPTEGTVRLAGKDLSKPLTLRVALACALVGLFTALTMAVLTLNVDRLWWNLVIRPMNDPVAPFSYRELPRRASEYMHGRLALVPERMGRWRVTSANGIEQLDSTTSREQAAAAAENLQQLIDLIPERQYQLIERDGKVVATAPDGRALATYLDRGVAEVKLNQLRMIGGQQRATPRYVRLAALVGLAVGTAGAYAVWNRSRRRPDLIARAGIARTFQNIRLFADMTVLENVQMGLDQRDARRPLATLFRLPVVRREERASRNRALELLDFVGLREKRNTLACELAYGQQRRLEIVRALATSPRLLLLDEPAAGMNPTETAELIPLIRTIRDSGVTVLLIEHHMNLVMDISDRIVVLDHGVKIAEGTPEQIRADRRVIEAYLGQETLA